jgi:NAD(P)H-dependent flavin oxidoreductase YrpB (nitropropane dioxygenase family)
MVGCPHPLQQAGIAGMTSPALAIAVAEAGALGMLTGTIGSDALAAQLDVLPAGARTPAAEIVDELVGEAGRLLSTSTVSESR